MERMFTDNGFEVTQLVKDEKTKFVKTISIARITVITMPIIQLEPKIFFRCSTSAPARNLIIATLVNPNRIISINPEATV